MVPSIKGFGCRPVIRRLESLGDASCGANGELHPDALRLVANPPAPTAWVPMRLHVELLRTLRELLGGAEDSVVRFAHETTEEVLSAPALRTLMGGVGMLKSSLGPTMVTMARFGFNFGSWAFEGKNLLDYRVIATGVEPVSEEVRLNIQGFMDIVSSRLAGETIVCTSTRVSPDQIVFEAHAARR